MPFKPLMNECTKFGTQISRKTDAGFIYLINDINLACKQFTMLIPTLKGFKEMLDIKSMTSLNRSLITKKFWPGVTKKCKQLHRCNKESHPS